MTTRKLGKNLVFFNPGKKGAVFTYQEGYVVDFNMIDNTISYLEDESEETVVCIEDRRNQKRMEV